MDVGGDDLEAKVLRFLEVQKRSTATPVIFHALKVSKSVINSALYALQSKGLAAKTSDVPPRWVATATHAGSRTTDASRLPQKRSSDEGRPNLAPKKRRIQSEQVVTGTACLSIGDNLLDRSSISLDGSSRPAVGCASAFADGASSFAGAWPGSPLPGSRNCASTERSAGPGDWDTADVTSWEPAVPRSFQFVSNAPGLRQRLIDSLFNNQPPARLPTLTFAAPATADFSACRAPFLRLPTVALAAAGKPAPAAAAAIATSAATASAVTTPAPTPRFALSTASLPPSVAGASVLANALATFHSESQPQALLDDGPSGLNTAGFLGSGVLDALGKNPVSALMEYAQARGTTATLRVERQRGPPHRPVFDIVAAVGSRTFPAVECSSKKEGKVAAADRALRVLMAEGAFEVAGKTLSAGVASSTTHFDRIAALVHAAFAKLQRQLLTLNLSGKKVLAGLVVISPAGAPHVISLGTGTRCITGPQLSMEGNTVNDCHAEIITRRGFLRYLYHQLELFADNPSDSILEPASAGKLKIRDGYTFHLYISTAPCGDGALFSPRDSSSASLAVDPEEHRPTYTSAVQGVLRTKIEGGEGTIPIDGKTTQQTWDGIQRGERLLTMSCSDKVCRWNTLGLQGALLSCFLEPVYLNSITLGFLFDPGHLSRAVCCRLGPSCGLGSTDARALVLPEAFRLNHPCLGRITAYDVSRELQKSNEISINWTCCDGSVEALDGTRGLNVTRSGAGCSLTSRLAKRSLFARFHAVSSKLARSAALPTAATVTAAAARDSLGGGRLTYRDAKLMAKDFQAAKEEMLRTFERRKFGAWVSRPIEEKLFLHLPADRTMT